MGKENKNEVLKFQEPALQCKQSCIKRLSDDQKRMILHAHLVNGVSKAELARVFGIRWWLDYCYFNTMFDSNIL